MPSSKIRKEKRRLQKLSEAGMPLSETYKMPEYMYRQEPNQLNAYRQYYKFVVYAEAMSRIQWKNLPEDVDARFLELSLFLYGQATITKIDGKFISQIATQYNLWDRQGNFTKWLATGYNGEFNITDYKKSVLIYDNLMRVAPSTILQPLIEDTSQAMVTASSNLIQQRYGVFFQAGKNNMKDAKKLARMVGLGEVGAVSVSELQDNIGVKTINPEVEDKTAISFSAKKEFLNEIHMFLGTDYIEHEKKERMIATEADANLDKVNRQRELFLIPRQKACEQMNKMFGWNVSVEWSDAGQDSVKNKDINNEEEDIQEDLGGEVNEQS